ncbi:MAG TPA: 1,2-phenylacetyl-CoA epoxidase subunit PaaD [Chitinophagaceae bacterium]|nr:1,2-phenylacetyl-CoA epoxidase subunit PaaD [Chitinophagaceae bacterium]
MNKVLNITKEDVWKIMDTVMDPEVPVLSVIDLGIIRKIELLPPLGGQGGAVEVTITPTYSGCPAMDVIAINIRMELLSQGFSKVDIKQVLSPAWTTDWMSEAGKEKLRAYGIAPPNPKQQVCRDELFAPDETVQCPHCYSFLTRRISEFGSTACKALYQCNDCQEPFDYFKCH